MPRLVKNSSPQFLPQKFSWILFQIPLDKFSLYATSFTSLSHFWSDNLHLLKQSNIFLTETSALIQEHTPTGTASLWGCGYEGD